jgi:predicted nicotinamide N-methyase
MIPESANHLLMNPANLSARRSRLLARIHRRYQTITETHAIGPLRLAFTRVADPNAVLDQVCRDEDRREKSTGQRRDGNDLHMPYWAELWDSAFGIARIVESGEWSVESKNDRHRRATLHAPAPRPSPLAPSVLDLGCGMGFTGMVAAAMGASVLFADLESDCLLFARLNSLPWTGRVRTRRLNWQIDRLGETFDLILGADVLYDHTQWDYLDSFFRHHISPTGSILLGEPGRQTGDRFPDWITPRGWKLDRIDQPVPTRTKPIRIFRLTLSKPASR